MSYDASEESCFVENNLLGVRQKLSMESEELDTSELSGERKTSIDEGKEQERGHSTHESSEGTKDHVIGETRLQVIISLLTLV